MHHHRFRVIMLGVAIAALASAAAAQGLPGCADLALQISEVRVDGDEYLEIRGVPGTALDQAALVIIGGTSPNNLCGLVWQVVPLEGVIPDDGHYLVSQNAAVLGEPTDFVVDPWLNLYDTNNLTLLLVCGVDPDYTGTDLDSHNDWVLDDEPWLDVIDDVALTHNFSSHCMYADVVLGPSLDTTLQAPRHVYRCEPDGVWVLTDLATGVAADTPGQPNATCPATGPCPENIFLNEIRNEPDGEQYFEIKGDPGTSLANTCILVIDEIGADPCGHRRETVFLEGTIPANGHFVVAETPTILGRPADQVYDIQITYSNSPTYMLLCGCDEINAFDFDPDSDGVLENTPWEDRVDDVSLRATLENGCLYSDQIVVEEGFEPSLHVWRTCGDKDHWSGGAGLDTPGEPNCACVGDTNGDLEVDVNDLNNVFLDWGTDGSANGGDMTGSFPGSPPDGIVNVNDLNAVILGWGCSI